jgi:acetyltransferase-like isoleucine patch superfamily enzyme
MRIERLYHSVRLLLCRTADKRAAYLKKHDILGAIGENCRWGPWLLPLYPKLIKLHNNVIVHKTAHIVPHDVINRFLKTAYPDYDFGHWEKVGCIEIMDNVYISAYCTIMSNVRINQNCIISSGSVVTSDIPENSLASGNPAKPTGRFDMFVALRKMSKGQTVKFKNQELSDEMAEAEWTKFYNKHNS